MTSIAGTIHNQAEEKDESTVARACKYIQENFRQELSLDDVSKEVNVSPYYFSKLFKEEVGENFIDYLTALRIGNAKELLKRPILSVREAGLQSGYADPNYFSRIFKKHTGMTPREYRERNL
jgi:two-component system response regulator YesN